MKDRFRAQVFTFDQQFQAYQKHDFALVWWLFTQTQFHLYLVFHKILSEYEHFQSLHVYEKALNVGFGFQAFLQDANVISHLQVLSCGGKWVPLGEHV